MSNKYSKITNIFIDLPLTFYPSNERHCNPAIHVAYNNVLVRTMQPLTANLIPS